VKTILLLVSVSLCGLLPTCLAQGTAFTYQGKLNDAGGPANGSYDFQFTVLDTAIGGNKVGINPLSSTVFVTNGLFSVMLDPGPGVFTGAARWLEVAVRTNGAAVFTTLAPRQLIAATPYAIQAAAYTGPITDTQLSTNIALLNGSNMFSGPVAFNNPSNTFTGTFAGDASGLSGVVTNALEVLLFTNKTVIYRGQTYCFSNSTTAGMDELQRLFPKPTNGGPSGLAIRLADSGEYTFTTPIYLSNNVTIVGAGMWSSGFIYRGPVNLWTLQTVMNNPKAAGLFNCVTNVWNPAGSPAAYTALGDFNFRQFYIKTAVDFPCVLLDMTANFVQLDHVGLFGPDVLSSAWTGYNINPLEGQLHTPLAAVGAYFDVYAQLHQYGCVAMELAAGYDYIGNTVVTANDNAVYNIGVVDGVAYVTNAYPATHLYSLGPGFILEQNLFSGILVNNQDYKVGLPYLLNNCANVEILGFLTQYPKSGYVVGNTSLGALAFVEATEQGWPTQIYVPVTNGIAGYGFANRVSADPGGVTIHIPGLGDQWFDGLSPIWGWNTFSDGPPQATFNIPVVGTNNQGIFFTTNNTAPNGSLGLFGGLVYVRTNNTWKPGAISQ
jgi:hypothetical protein